MSKYSELPATFRTRLANAQRDVYTALNDETAGARDRQEFIIARYDTLVEAAAVVLDVDPGTVERDVIGAVSLADVDKLIGEK